MHSRWQMLALVLSFSLGCSQEDPVSPDGSGEKARMKAYLDSPEYKKAVEENLALMKKEEEVREEADWFGRTGLSDALERELPRYLRRELGQSLFDADSMQASDLTYVGEFMEGDTTVHYWRVPQAQATDTYAYIEISVNGDSVIGWGDKQPPR
jgi:hypothetical protein